MNKYDVIDKRFQILKGVETGGTASIFKAYDDVQDMQVAVKVYDSLKLPEEILNEIWNRERDALMQLDHPNIISFITAGKCEKTQKKYIALELFEGRTLDDILNRQSPIEYKRFYSQYGEKILEALVYAAENGVIHRDISLKNILVDSQFNLKIIDFGIARVNELSVGKTVAGYGTPPYSPPEPDIGIYTARRDAFSYCAIAVRAVSGKSFSNHEELFEEFSNLDNLDKTPEIFKSALSRVPEERPENIITFYESLKGARVTKEIDKSFVIYLRVIPEVQAKLNQLNTVEETGLNWLVSELNEMASISKSIGDGSESRFNIETKSFHVHCDLDSYANHIVVIIGFSKRVFEFGGLWREKSWQPTVTFIPKIPVTPKEIEKALSSLHAFYQSFTLFLSSLIESDVTSGDSLIENWGNFLDAMTSIEKNRVPALGYSKPDVSENLLHVELNNSHGAEVGQVRLIQDSGKYVFKGEIFSIKGTSCTLLSKRRYINQESIPGKGLLENDWYMTRIALSRQRTALEKFSNNDLFNSDLSKIVLLKDAGGDQASFARDLNFFNKKLSAEKKAVVSQFLAMQSLLLVHGPPGTGKTTLIVELVRQFLKQDPHHRILLVSQTHVAIDHALSGVMRDDPELNIVRIGSGSRELDERVLSCSIEERGKKLREKVGHSTKDYINEISQKLNIDLDEIEFGILAAEVVRCRELLRETEDETLDIEESLESRQISLDKILKDGVTLEIDTAKSKMATLESKLVDINETLASAKAELEVARQNLLAKKQQGKSLAKLGINQLKAKCDELLSGPSRGKIRKLVEISEDWRFKFSSSEDFRTAIIMESAIVAGTCVGFAREKAAALSTFDLCIIDESSKATSTELLVPLSISKKAVLVGDHHQLSAIVDFALRDRELQKEFSLTEESIEKQLFETLQESLNDEYKASLTEQFRMNTEIGNLVSHCFYDDELVTSPETDSRERINLSLAQISSPLVWINTRKGSRSKIGQQQSGNSFFNAVEGDCIIESLKRISWVISKSGRNSKFSIGVISGYLEQARYLQRLIDAEASLDNLDIECATVHQFQGREVDMCFYSITRDDIRKGVGFLSDWKHLNVALSRARDYLVIVGSFEYCLQADKAPHLQNLANYFLDNYRDRIQDLNNA